MAEGLDSVRFLLERGAPVNPVDKLGRQPIHIFAGAPDNGRITALLDHGVALNALTTDGQTPLDVAASSGRMDVVKLLLARGARPTRRTLAGAMRVESPHPEVARILKRHMKGAGGNAGRMGRP